MNKVLAAVVGCASLLIVANVATTTATQAAPHASHAKHKHAHMNGHDLLGANLKKDGKHGLGKLGANDVVAEVKGGKVVKMSAGTLPVKHVKSSTKMARSEGPIVRVSLPLQLAQYDQTYYAYCFDDGVTYTCYWYPESDVDPAAYTWDPYDPTY
jgi:CRISPR/Cas system-associated exonuclease Cas4 (RecB family)